MPDGANSLRCYILVLSRQRQSAIYPDGGEWMSSFADELPRSLKVASCRHFDSRLSSQCYVCSALLATRPPATCRRAVHYRVPLTLGFRTSSVID